MPTNADSAVQGSSTVTETSISGPQPRYAQHSPAAA